MTSIATYVVYACLLASSCAAFAANQQVILSFSMTKESSQALLTKNVQGCDLTHAHHTSLSKDKFGRNASAVSTTFTPSRTDLLLHPFVVFAMPKRTYIRT